MKSAISYQTSAFRLIVIICAFFTLYSLIINQVHAQSLDFAISYDVVDSEAVDGDILITTDKGLVRADGPDSTQMFGVLQSSPLIVVEVEGDTSQQPIARTGVASVNITNEGGNIKRGDYITSSATPGKGMKAQYSGYVIGTALNDFNFNNETEAQIPVALRIEFAEIDGARSTSQIADFFGASLLQNIKDPEKFAQLIRFLVAGSIAIGGFMIAFFAFSRSIPASIEAIGRNPLARSSIMFTIFINIGLTITTVLVSIGAAFLILRF